MLNAPIRNSNQLNASPCAVHFGGYHRVTLDRRLNKGSTIMSENSESQARAQLSSIIEMVDNLRKARESEDDGAISEAERAIHEDALSVEVRSNWRAPGDSPDSDVEFRILLCTGGPAVQITGTLNEYSEPETARIEFQDWFEPWKPLPFYIDDEQEKLLAYCQCFWFGE